MVSEVEIQIITPPVADQSRALDHGLVTLTEAICQAIPDIESGHGLGGRFGYGENFENDVFVMRRYYWGDCDCGFDQLEWKWCEEHKHSPSCYQTELDQRRRAAGLPYWDGARWHDMDKYSYEETQKIEDGIYRELCAKHGKDREFGAAVHCSCSYEPRWKAWSVENKHSSICTPNLPNFLHKRTGLEVRWYKWIGRGMEALHIEGVDLHGVFAECLASLTTGHST